MNPSPEATLLLQKYTKIQIAEKVVELEAQVEQYQSTGNMTHLGVALKIRELEAENTRLVRYVKTKNKLDELPDTAEGSAFEKCWDEVGEAYQALSDETRKAIEND